jgi:hypothetical protein
MQPEPFAVRRRLRADDVGKVASPVGGIPAAQIGRRLRTIPAPGLRGCDLLRKARQQIDPAHLVEHVGRPARIVFGGEEVAGGGHGRERDDGHENPSAGNESAALQRPGVSHRPT